jgi:DUF2911 family protein
MIPFRTLSVALSTSVVIVLSVAAQAPVKAKLASPRDTTRATIARANLEIDYGRPSKRGRKIIDGLVPYGRVWRTGANEATGFVTSRPLQFGSLAVPAGKYTLWTLPSAAGWKLIINRQTGQFGTEYDPTQDLGRVDMKVESLPADVEKFVIKLTPAPGGGVLALEWEKTRASIPFLVH